MGMLRLLLAFLVLLSHADVRIGTLNPGVTAVMVFYLISGFVMAGLLRRHYAQPAQIPHFYADRVLRLFPQYLFYMAAALVWHWWTSTSTLFLTRSPSALDLFNNLSVIPLNFFMFNGADGYTLVPPAWSLGAELQFYLLAPLMLLWPRVGVALACLSLAVHVAAMHALLNTDWFGYRLLAGVLWAFAAGMLLFELLQRRSAWAHIVALAAPAVAFAVYLYLRARHLDNLPYNQEVLLGWGLGLPLLYAVAAWRGSRFDALAGDLSYGMFLNHFLLIWILLPATGRTPLQLTALALCSLALSWCSQRLIEKPVLTWRQRLRKRNDAQGNSESVT